MTIDPAKVDAAIKALVHSGGTPTGQFVHLDADVYHEVLAILRAVSRGERLYAPPMTTTRARNSDGS